MPMTYPDDFTSPDASPIDSAVRNVKLKDYYCPFCNYKLFRGNVNEFKLVCQECNRLVDSSTLKKNTDFPTDDDQNSAV